MVTSRCMEATHSKNYVSENIPFELKCCYLNEGSVKQQEHRGFLIEKRMPPTLQF